MDDKKEAGKDANAEDAGLDETVKGDKALRIGSAHGADTLVDEKVGYARDISQGERPGEAAGGVRTRGAGLNDSGRKHPSKSLETRSRGFGIGGGYERPYRKEKPKTADSDSIYGPLPHAGYYGTGAGLRPFKKGQAGFSDELSWYRLQYGERTSGYEKRKK
jgi:hypothetical protein